MALLSEHPPHIFQCNKKYKSIEHLDDLVTSCQLLQSKNSHKKGVERLAPETLRGLGKVAGVG